MGTSPLAPTNKSDKVCSDGEAKAIATSAPRQPRALFTHLGLLALESTEAANKLEDEASS